MTAFDPKRTSGLSVVRILGSLWGAQEKSLSIKLLSELFLLSRINLLRLGVAAA
jgi:hypothetical protein